MYSIIALTIEKAICIHANLYEVVRVIMVMKEMMVMRIMRSGRRLFLHIFRAGMHAAIEDKLNHSWETTPPIEGACRQQRVGSNAYPIY